MDITVIDHSVEDLAPASDPFDLDLRLALAPSNGAGVARATDGTNCQPTASCSCITCNYATCGGTTGRPCAC